MGSFAGHILPGSFLLVMAIWWLLNVMNRYYKCLSTPGERYHNTVTFPMSCCPWKLKNIHWEAVFKIIACAIGMAGEIATAFFNNANGWGFYYGNLQHTTMFFFFGLTGVFDLMVKCKVALPEDIDYIMMSLAFAVEGLLFYFHLDGRAELDTQLHRLLLIAIACNFITSMVEMKLKRNVLVALLRTFFLFLQGTWFYQIAFILYNPGPYSFRWIIVQTKQLNKHELLKLHDQIMMVTCMFTWHAAGIILLMMLTGCAFRYYHKKTSRTARYDRVDTVQLIKTRHNGQRIISLPGDDNNDSGSDIEFEQDSGSPSRIIDVN